MKTVYVAQFGQLNIRFALREGDVFVSKSDLFAAITDCFTEKARLLGHDFIETGLSFFADTADKNSVLLGDSEIGPAIQFHAAGNLLHSLSDLIDVDDRELRESSFRVSSLLRWYCRIMPQVDQYFGRRVEDMLASVKNRLDRHNPAIPVEISFGDGMYTAECDALSLVTEAKTFEELTELVWELVPDMIEVNELEIDPDSVRLRFEMAQSAGQLKAN
ncbi:DUF1902 domain-containing protein [Oceanospirillum linum]|nr:DUF1902 domain-containing protein [Oceanospirillum linum]SEF43063.1 protein of unknown function [Oleiphilus messinensis]SMP01240.1 protein of unknown function [Oceanospirillum linum]